MSSYYTELDSDRGWDEIVAEEDRERREIENDKMLSGMRARYRAARAADIGAAFPCPTCQKLTVKTTYHKAFCSNQKTHGRKNCKDRFWNMTDETRRARAKGFSQ